MKPPSIENANMAIVLLFMFVAFSMIFGGPRGYRWAMRLILAPIRLIISMVEKKIAAFVAGLVLIALTGYGIMEWVARLLK